MLKITVKFPEGEREVPAYQSNEGEIFGYDRGPIRKITKLVPESMPGWDFVEDIAGNWYAHRALE